MPAMTIPLLLIFLLNAAQVQPTRFSDAAAGVSFSYPSSWQITEQSQDYSLCSWFVTLTSGSAELRINFTGNTFQAVAESEYFQTQDGQWTLGGKPARVASGSFYRALEGERSDPRGNTLAVTLAMIERAGKCSVVFTTSSPAARKTIYTIAEGFRFTR